MTKLHDQLHYEYLEELTKHYSGSYTDWLEEEINRMRDGLEDIILEREAQNITAIARQALQGKGSI